MREPYKYRRIFVGPNIAVRRDGDHYRVWSPVLRKDLILLPAEVSFLLKFSGEQRVDQLWPELIELQKALDSDARTETANLNAYLRIEKFLLQGLLAEEILLAHDQLGNLHFSQHSSESQNFFETWLGPHHAVQVKHLPYREFLQAPHNSIAEQTLYQYWSALDGHYASVQGPEGRNGYKAKSRALLRLFEEYKSYDNPEQKLLKTSFLVCRRPDGDLALLDNAELASIAFNLGLSASARVLQGPDFLGRLVELPREFFGTMRGNIPYHTVFYRGEELIPGRRPDLYERLEKISNDDLQGKAVLDLGCNIGMNCYLSVEKGARLATGIDLPELVGAATRLNAFFALPCRFIARDLNYEVTGIGDYDTVFLFALLGHLRAIEGLVRTIKSCNARTVYVETHCEVQEQGELNRFLTASIFRKVEFIGNSLDNSVCPNRTRRMYRCQVAGSS